MDAHSCCTGTQGNCHFTNMWQHLYDEQKEKHANAHL